MRDTQIDTDGITVWVNDSNGCIARFGVMGIDVHHKLEEQKRQGECLFCTHAKVTAQDWDTFKAKVLEHHGVVVSDRYKPKRFCVVTASGNHKKA
jgi:hypothetical protein